MTRAAGNNDMVQIVHDAPERKYYATIPHIVDDLGLTVHAYRLYGRIVRRAGDNGACWESVRNLAKGCRMGKNTITRARNELAQPRPELGDKPLVHVESIENPNGGKDNLRIRITDIWQENIDRYSKYLNRDLSNTQSGTCQVPKKGQKKNQFKDSAEKEKLGASERASLATPGGVDLGRGDDSSSASDTHTFTPRITKEHPTIRAIKEITRYYPNKATWPAIVDKFPDGLDMERATIAFGLWVGEGNNPMNINGWLFDRYATDSYYLHPSRKVMEPNIKNGLREVQP